MRTEFALDNPVTLSFDLLTSRSMPSRFYLHSPPTSVMIARAVFFFRAQTDTQTDKLKDGTDRPTHATATAGVITTSVSLL